MHPSPTPSLCDLQLVAQFLQALLLLTSRTRRSARQLQGRLRKSLVGRLRPRLRMPVGSLDTASSLFLLGEAGGLAEMMHRWADGPQNPQGGLWEMQTVQEGGARPQPAV